MWLASLLNQWCEWYFYQCILKWGKLWTCAIHLASLTLLTLIMCASSPSVLYRRPTRASAFRFLAFGPEHICLRCYN